MKISERDLKDPSKLQQLLSNNASRSLRVGTDDLQVALRDACLLGRLTKSVQILLDNGANPNKIPGRTSGSYIPYADRHSTTSCSCFNTPLQLCIINDDCETAEILLSKNADPNLIKENLTDTDVELRQATDVKDEKYEMYWCRNYPPLHLATRHGHATMVSLLLRWGAEQTPLIETGEFPVHIAAREGHGHLIELFCSLDNKWVNCKTEKPKLQSRKDHGNSGETPLHIACKFAHIDCVSLLLDHLKVDYQVRDDKNNTPLHSLVDIRPVSDISSFQKDSENRFAITTLLVRCRDFDINGVNKKKMTALNLAVKNHFSKISQLLNDIGAKPLDANNNESSYVAVEVCSNDDEDDDNTNLNKNIKNEDVKQNDQDKYPKVSTISSSEKTAITASNATSNVITAATTTATTIVTSNIATTSPIFVTSNISTTPMFVTSSITTTSPLSVTSKVTTTPMFVTSNVTSTPLFVTSSVSTTPMSVTSNITTTPMSVTSNVTSRPTFVTSNVTTTAKTTNVNTNVTLTTNVDMKTNTHVTFTSVLSSNVTTPSTVSTANNVPIVTSIFSEKKPDIQPQKYFFPNLDNEISSFNLSNKDKSDRFYVSFDKQKPPNNVPNNSVITNMDKNKNDEAKENKPAIIFNPQSNSNKKSDPILMKKITLKDVSITKTTIFTSTLDDNLTNLKHFRHDPYSPVFDPHAKVLTIKCPRSYSPLSFLSEGGRSKGLKLKVFGEVPKAYSSKQKQSARTDFILADPVGVESTEDSADVTRLSVYSLPDYYFRDNLLQRSVERREEWSKPLNPATTVVNKKYKHARVKSPPVCDPNLNSGGVRVAGKLIGFTARPYKTFGQIDTKTDALEDAMKEEEDISDEEDENEGIGQTYEYNKYHVKEWLSGGRGNSIYCPLESEEEFSSPDEKSVLRPKNNKKSYIDESERFSSSSVKIDDINFRIIQMPDIDKAKDNSQIDQPSKNGNQIYIEDNNKEVENYKPSKNISDMVINGNSSKIENNEKEPPSKTRIPSYKKQDSSGSGTITSTVVSSVQPDKQIISIAKLEDDDEEEEEETGGDLAKSGSSKNATVQLPSFPKKIPENKIKTVISTTDDKKTNKKINKKTKEEADISNKIKDENESNKLINDKTDINEINIKKDVIDEKNELDINTPDKKLRKSKIPIYKPQISSDKKSDKQSGKVDSSSNKPSENKEKNDDSLLLTENEEHKNSDIKNIPKINGSTDKIITDLRENKFPSKTTDVFVNLSESKSKKGSEDDKETNKPISDNKNVASEANENGKTEKNDDLLKDNAQVELPPAQNHQNQNPHQKSVAHDTPCVRIKKKSRPKIDDNFKNSVQNNMNDDRTAKGTQKDNSTTLITSYCRDETEKNEYDKEIHNLDEQIDKFADKNENKYPNKTQDVKNAVPVEDQKAVNKGEEDDNGEVDVLNKTFDKDESNVALTTDDIIPTKKKTKKKFKKEKSVDGQNVPPVINREGDSKKVTERHDQDDTKVSDDNRREDNENSRRILNRAFEDDEETLINDANKDETTNDIKNKFKTEKTDVVLSNVPDLISENIMNKKQDKQKKKKLKNKLPDSNFSSGVKDSQTISDKQEVKDENLNDDENQFEEKPVVDNVPTKDSEEEDVNGEIDIDVKETDDNIPKESSDKHNVIEEDTHEDRTHDGAIEHAEGNKDLSQDDTNNLDVLIPAHPSSKKETSRDDMNSKVRRDHLIHSIEHSENEIDENNLNQIVHAHSTDDDANKNHVSDVANEGIKKIKRKKSKKKSVSETGDKYSNKKIETNVDEDNDTSKQPIASTENKVLVLKDDDTKADTDVFNATNKDDSNRDRKINLKDRKKKPKKKSTNNEAASDNRKQSETSANDEKITDDEHKVSDTSQKMNRSRETNVDELSADEAVEDEKNNKQPINISNDNKPIITDLQDKNRASVKEHDNEIEDEDEHESFPPLPPLLLDNKTNNASDSKVKKTKKKNNIPSKKISNVDDSNFKNEVTSDTNLVDEKLSPVEPNKDRISDEIINRASSDSENNSSDPDASNYFEYHVDMDPRVPGKSRIRKTKHFYNDDGYSEEDIINDKNIVDTNNVENDTEGNKKKVKNSNKDATKPPPDDSELTETTTTTTVVVDEETVEEAGNVKRKKKKKVKERENKITNNEENMGDANNLSNGAGVHQPKENDKRTKIDSTTVDDKENDGYTSDDVNIVDDFDENKTNEADEELMFDKDGKDSNKNKGRKENYYININDKSVKHPYGLDDSGQNSYPKDKKGKKSFEIISDHNIDKNLIIEKETIEKQPDKDNSEKNISKKKKKKKVDDTNEPDINDQQATNNNQNERNLKKGKKRSKSTDIDDINGHDISSECSTTESTMNSYELKKKSDKPSKKKLGSLTTDDSGVHTNASLDMGSADDNPRDKSKRKSSKTIKEEENVPSTNGTAKNDIFKKQSKIKTEIESNEKGDKIQVKRKNGKQDDADLQNEDRTTLKTDEFVDDKKRIFNSKKGTDSIKKLESSFDDKLENKQKDSNENDLSLPKNWEKKKSNSKTSNEDDYLTEETTTKTEVTTYEEWLEMQRRLKNKSKINSSEEKNKRSDEKNTEKKSFETNFDTDIDDHETGNEEVNKRIALKDEESASDEEIVTEVLSPGSKPPLKRDIKPLIHPARDPKREQAHMLNSSDPEIISPHPLASGVSKDRESKYRNDDQWKDANGDKNGKNIQKGHVPRRYSEHSKSYEENINTTTTVVETVITDRWKRRSRRRPKSVSFENIPRRPQIQDRPLSVKAPDKTLEQAAFEMLQKNQADTWRKNWKANPVVYTRGVYRPQQPLYKRDGGVDGNASFKHDESRISQAFPPWSDTAQDRDGSHQAGTNVSSEDHNQDGGSPNSHNVENGTRYNEHVEEFVADDHGGVYHDDQFDDHQFNQPSGKNFPSAMYGKGYSPILFNSISRKVTYLRPIKRKRGYNSLSLYPVRGTMNQSSKDLAPRISEPVPSDLNKYGYLSKLWMEQVDRKTLQKCETMYLSVLPKGMQPLDNIEDSLFKRYLNKKHAFNDPKSSDADGSQWVIARGRSVRQAKRKWLEQKENKLLSGGDFGNSSFADVTGNVSPTRSMANRSFAGNVTSPGHPSAMLFFKIGQVNWPDLAWVLFDGIQSDAETVRMIADVRLRYPDDCGAQIRDLMARWWTKKGEAATIEELQTALEFVQIPFIQEEDQQANFFFPSKDGEDGHFEEEEYSPDESRSYARKSLLIKEVPEDDPDVSRMMYEYEHRSPNASFAALADQSQQLRLPPTGSSGNLLQVPSFKTNKLSPPKQDEDHSFANVSFSSTLKDKLFNPVKSKTTAKQHSLPGNMPESSINLGSTSSFRIFSSNVFGNKNRKSKNDSMMDASLAEDERVDKPAQKSYTAKSVDLESNI